MSVLSKHRRLITLVTAGALVAVGGPAASAAAAQTCTIKSFSPGKVKVNLSATGEDFSVSTSGCTQKSWRIDLVGSGDQRDRLLATKAKPRAVFDPSTLANSDAGKNKVRVTVKSTDGKTSKKHFAFSLLRRSNFFTEFKMGPESVTAGTNVKLTAGLDRLRFGAKPKYVNYAKQSVQVQFRASGTTAFVKKKTVKTDANGNIKSTVKVSKSGTWRLYFAGTSTTSTAVSNMDVVLVN